MTNYEWLRSLSIEDMAKMIGDVTCEMCFYNLHNQKCTQACVEGIAKWLKDKHIEPMPEIEEGDCIIIQEGSNLYRAICVYDNVIYSVVSGKFHIFDGKIKEDTVAIQSYNVKTGNFEDIWRRADNEEK